MTRRIIPRELAARELAVSTKVLARYESLGLVQVAQEGSEEGYEPAQVRRLWSIVTYQRDLGLFEKGVVAAQDRDQFGAVEMAAQIGALIVVGTRDAIRREIKALKGVATRNSQLPNRRARRSGRLRPSHVQARLDLLHRMLTQPET